jgi:hypothetical protein
VRSGSVYILKICRERNFVAPPIDGNWGNGLRLQLNEYQIQGLKIQETSSKSI